MVSLLLVWSFWRFLSHSLTHMTTRLEWNTFLFHQFRIDPFDNKWTEHMVKNKKTHFCCCSRSKWTAHDSHCNQFSSYFSLSSLFYVRCCGNKSNWRLCDNFEVVVRAKLHSHIESLTNSESFYFLRLIKLKQFFFVCVFASSLQLHRVYYVVCLFLLLCLMCECHTTSAPTFVLQYFLYYFRLLSRCRLNWVACQIFCQSTLLLGP